MFVFANQLFRLHKIFLQNRLCGAGMELRLFGYSLHGAGNFAEGIAKFIYFNFSFLGLEEARINEHAVLLSLLLFCDKDLFNFLCQLLL